VSARAAISMPPDTPKAAARRIRPVLKAIEAVVRWEAIVEDAVDRQGDLHDDDWLRLVALRAELGRELDGLKPKDRPILEAALGIRPRAPSGERGEQLTLGFVNGEAR
jgi:hypothetical protein